MLLRRTLTVNPVRSKTPKASVAVLMQTSNGVKVRLE